MRTIRRQPLAEARLPPPVRQALRARWPGTGLHVVVAAWLAAAVAPAQAAAAGGATASTAPEPAIAAAVAAQCERDGIPGLSCVVAVGPQIVFARGFGMADVENDVPATPATVYRLASISKPIAAVCALRLVEQGKLDLDADVHTFVPAWPAKPWPVTTRQLLAHLGGVRHYRPGEGESTRHYSSQSEALVRFAADPLLHEPGTAFHYSTYGYCLAAAVVEQAAGQPFAQVVTDLVAVPSGAATLQDDDVQRLIRRRAQGYVKSRDGLRNSALMDASYKLGGGGLCSSAEDLARFAQALLQGKLLRPETRAAMWTRQRQADGKQLDYGLGFRLGERAGQAVVSHSGAQSRVSTLLYLLPEPQVVVVLLCNLEKVTLQPLAQQIAQIVAPVAAK
jgi:serine beta-lactamase-like protein LACTB